MAISRTRSGLEVFLDAGRTFIHRWQDDLKTSRAWRQAYRATYRELAMLSDRDLADLGIARGEIRRISLEAANGK